MSTIFLSANDTFTQPSTNTGDSFFGRASGSETVILQGNPTGTVLDGNIETVQVAGPAAVTTLQLNPITGRLELLSGGLVYATFSSGLNQSVDLQFTDGNVTLTQTGANTFMIANPTDAASSATISPTTPQAGSSVSLGSSTSMAGDTSTPGSAPTFSISSGAATVTEGAIATFTLTTTNVTVGTDIPYTITGVSAVDVVGGLTGTATVGAGGTASISVQIVADQLTEGSETLTVSVNNGLASASTTVQDTSVANSNSYTSGLGLNGVTSAFNIEVIFVGTFEQIYKNAFITAADYLSTIIVGDLPDAGAIDDIRITAELKAIDGPSGVLGSAGPTILRPGSALPSEGEMEFDTADIVSMQAGGTLTDTILHEMIHALGFGTIWETLNLLQGTTDLRFTGSNGIAAYNAEFTAIAGADTNSTMGVPVETDGGEGTAGGHWDEETFLTEMMTGFSDATNYVSAMTVASLEDLGYDTIFNIGTPSAAIPQLDTFMMA